MADRPGTRTILDKLTQGPKPFHLMSEEERKKENEKLFAEVAYAVFLESLYVYQNQQRMREQMIQALNLAHEQSLKAYREKELAITIILENRRNVESLSKDQLERLNAVKTKLQNTLAVIDEKIKQLEKRIESHDTKIIEAASNVIEKKRALATHWVNHFHAQAADADYVPKRFQIPLPKTWEKAEGAHKYPGYVEIDKPTHQQIHKEIADELSSSAKDVTQVEVLVGDKVGKILESILKDKWSFIPDLERDKHVASNVKQISKSYISELIFGAMQDSKIANAHKEAMQAQQLHASLVLEKQILQQQHQNLLEARETVENRLEKLEELGANSAKSETTNLPRIDNGTFNQIVSSSEKLDVNVQSLVEGDMLAMEEEMLDVQKTENNFRKLEQAVEAQQPTKDITQADRAQIETNLKEIHQQTDVLVKGSEMSASEQAAKTGGPEQPKTTQSVEPEKEEPTDTPRPT